MRDSPRVFEVYRRAVPTVHRFAGPGAAGPTGHIVDLGCGPGNMTRLLLERWPAAQVIGVDNSPDMLQKAKQLAVAGQMDFVNANISAWSPSGPVDLLFSNAALQWVSDHEHLIPRLAGLVGPGGTLAVQNA